MLKLTKAEFDRYCELDHANQNIVEIIDVHNDNAKDNFIVTHMPTNVSSTFRYQRQVGKVLGITKDKVQYMLRRGEHIYGDYFVDKIK